MPVDSLMEKRPVIDLSLSTSALSAGTIEPLLEDIPVTSQGIFKRLHINFIIFFRPICRVIPVPRGNIDAEFQSVLTAGIGKFPEDIPIPIPPGAVRHSMTAHRIRPQAESVVMLPCDDNTLHPRSLCRTRPLPAVKVCRGEHICVLLAASPFHISKCIRAEMHEHIRLHFLPFQLAGRRHRTIRLRGINTGTGYTEHCGY